MESAAEIFSILSDPTRVRIILALREYEELSVGRLADIVGKEQTAVSHHLAKLRLKRMVTTRRHGIQVFYRLAGRHTQQLVSEAIFQVEHSTDHEQPHYHPPTDTGPWPTGRDSF
ncbi:ArsR/SmtB family transcription factor [Nocardia grenadensis]